MLVKKVDFICGTSTGTTLWRTEDMIISLFPSPYLWCHVFSNIYCAMEHPHQTFIPFIFTFKIITFSFVSLFFIFCKSQISLTVLCSLSCQVLLQIKLKRLILMCLFFSYCNNIIAINYNVIVICFILNSHSHTHTVSHTTKLRFLFSSSIVQSGTYDAS